MRNLPVFVFVLLSTLLIVGCPDPTAIGNGGGDPTRVAAPVFTPNPANGPFDSTLSVSVSSSTPGASIYYVWDFVTSADPDESSNPYTGPLFVPVTRQLRAIAYKDGLNPSSVSEATITLTPLSLPADTDFEDGSTGGWDLTGGVVDGTLGANGSSKSVKLSGSSGELELRLRGAAPASIRFYLRTDQSDGSYGGVNIGNFSLVSFFLGSGGLFSLDYNDLSAYSPDVWYKIELVFDYTAPRNVDVYIDDVLAAENSSIIDTGYDILWFNGSDNAEIWIDEIVVQ